MGPRPEPVEGFDVPYGGQPVTNMRDMGGRRVPAIPLRAPLDVRWRCRHVWTPHVYDNGMTAWNYFDCVRCGADVEAGVQPANGPWRIRSWVAGKLSR